MNRIILGVAGLALLVTTVPAMVVLASYTPSAPLQYQILLIGGLVAAWTIGSFSVAFNIFRF